MTSAPKAVGVIGGGRMGSGIAQSFAAAGSAVTVAAGRHRGSPGRGASLSGRTAAVLFRALTRPVLASPGRAHRMMDRTNGR
ncbi:3-hydroxyacyl-CoA dehydrogenase NAD-binding domain-containing protein [Streptomyces sp. NPDC058470]|uniref:3-hydroxyacyl-CoA dehydrogenase NAD-binding domain-containing protein n=1 Tax=Streptomyces sp. NPDC058470 TaxID=3346515 RepID=UPI00364EBCE5